MWSPINSSALNKGKKLSFRPEDAYLIIIKILLLITAAPTLFGFIGGLFKLSTKSAFMVGAFWWILVEIATAVDRGGVFFWRELYYMISEYSRPATGASIGLVGLIFSIVLAGTAASGFARLGIKIVGAKPKKVKAKR